MRNVFGKTIQLTISYFNTVEHGIDIGGELFNLTRRMNQIESLFKFVNTNGMGLFAQGS
ncbi:hypothetical protein D3C75_1129880 [compost metagenome]